MNVVRLAALSACLSAAFAAVANPRIPLWPEGKMPLAQPQQIAAMTDEAGRWPQEPKPGFDPAAHRMPYLEWWDPPAPGNRTDACVILISGGGYNTTCDVRLVKDWGAKFTALGVQCVTLVYRTPRPEGLPYYASAWADGQRAVRLVRAEAAARGFSPDKVGTISMSAGSHLAMLLSTSSLTPAYEPVDALDAAPCNIDFAFVCAFAYGLTDGLGVPNTTAGNGPGVALDPIFRFDAKTAPTCFFHGGRDNYSPVASTFAYRRLRQMKVPAELHLYGDRRHSFFGWNAGAEGSTGYDNWFGRAAEFLRQLEIVGKLPRERKEDHVEFPDWTLRTEKEILWPEGKMPDPQPNQKITPYLVWYVPEKLSTRAVQVIVPGGAYQSVNINGEGTPTAHYFNKHGMTAVVVRYRFPRPQGGLPKHWTAWQDAQRAIRMVKAEAPARGLDPERVGLMGFSAGGHLTVFTAVNSLQNAYDPVDEIDRQSLKLAWACPIYPAYLLTDGANGANAHGGNLPEDALLPDLTFDAATPPMCFVHGDADVIASMNSVLAWERLRRQGLQGDLHTLALRGHCFQVSRAPGTGSDTWLDRIWEFLNHKGLNK